MMSDEWQKMRFPIRSEMTIKKAAEFRSLEGLRPFELFVQFFEQVGKTEADCCSYCCEHCGLQYIVPVDADDG